MISLFLAVIFHFATFWYIQNFIINLDTMPLNNAFSQITNATHLPCITILYQIEETKCAHKMQSLEIFMR
jgi:hypothetical protein